MNYYCEICDKTIKIKSKNVHPKFLTRNQYQNCIRIISIFRNPYFFNIVIISNDYIINHIKNFDLCFLKIDFKLDFNNFIPPIKTDFHHITTIINLK